MKTLIKSFALVLSLAAITVSTSFAGTTETNPIRRSSTVASYKTGIYTTVSGKLNIALDKETNGRVDIRLMDTSGKVLYVQYLGKRDRGCRVSLNLGDLADGTYTLEITNGVDTKTQSVVISTNQPASSNRLVAIN